MPTIDDKEFGEITVRRSSLARNVKISLAPDGRLRVSAPKLAPLFAIKRIIASSRSELRKMMESQPQLEIVDGMAIGKSHRLEIRHGNKLSASRHDRQIVLTLDESTLSSPSVAKILKPHIITALKREAKAHLTKRLAHLASKHSFSYQNVRFSHASGRWGSCSSNGTISLNIALMNLPFELIDYVLIHELAHTKQMNHSSDFWQIVGNIDSDYKLHRKELKKHSPSI